MVPVFQNGVKILAVMSLFMLMSCKPDDVHLSIGNVVVSQNMMDLQYAIENRSTSPIWVCTDIEDRNDRLDYELCYSKWFDYMRIKIVDLKVPYNIHLEEPIWAKYVKLQPGRKYEFHVQSRLPVKQVRGFKHSTGNESGTAVSEKISLEVATYSSLNVKDTTSCRGDSNEEVAYVSCFAAKRNGPEVLKVEKTNVRVPVALE